VKIAVTGAAGTIGRRLCADLAQDHDVIGIDLRDAGVIADVQDLDALVAAFDGCETVVHLAGVVSVTTSWEQTHGPNIAGTYNAFEAAHRAGVKRVIFASSNHAVGRYEIENLPQIYEPGFGLVVRTTDRIAPTASTACGKRSAKCSGAITARRSACR
jgi:NAD+ dependent glucose-6-phosphate dehydrogenase